MTSDTLHYTDILNPCKQVTCGPQKKNWIEYQLLDEQGEPLAGIPYRATNEATRIAMLPEYTGFSDTQGIIRIEGLHPLAITLQLAADPLAGQLQQRRLRALRPEPPRPAPLERTPLHGAQRKGFSPIERQATEQGHAWHYLRVGQLCDGLPVFDPPLEDPRDLPGFHFPDPDFAGFTLGDDQLNRRHVLEVCPLRAWSLLLHHQQQYSLVNAYNLGLMSNLAYSDTDPQTYGSVEHLFLQQCLDLSRTPRIGDGGQHWPCLVTDVPFNARYIWVRLLDTAKAEVPEGHTQMFYAISATQVIVAWRGTEGSDVETDLSFRPVEPKVQANCESKVSCAGLVPEGNVHFGFLEGFEVAIRVFPRYLNELVFESAGSRELFVCGHSLGGALGIIHAAALREKNPLLYTYGMPRTFTLKAVQYLEGLCHFRHINDIDPIPSVPPEAELDNHLYKLYGHLGTSLGFVWSMGQLAASQVFRFGDPFCHHGEVVMFFMARQHLQQRGSSYPAYRNKDGLGAPYHSTVSRRLPEITKLYLVPSLDEAESQEAEQVQKRFTASLTADSKARYFPPTGNPRSGRLIGMANHFMGGYLRFIHGQLLECIDAGRDPLLKQQIERQRFEQQMREYFSHLFEDEVTRNRLFLDLQKQLGRALDMTRTTQDGSDALLRFDALADAEAGYGSIYS